MSAPFARRVALPALLTVATGGFVAVDVLQARPYTAVKVEGSTFIPAEDITAACEIVADDYRDEDLSYIRDCLMSSGQFADVSLRGEGETLVVKVEELNTRPGRVEVGLAYDSRDGVVANLYFERYNLFPDTFGSVDLQFAEESKSLSTALYKAKAWGDFDFGIDTLLRQTEFDDQGFTNRRAMIEPYLGYRFGEFTKLELGLGYRRDEMRDIRATTSALFLKEQGTVDAPYLRLGYRFATNPSEHGGWSRMTGLSVSVDHYAWGLGSDDRTSETRVDIDTRLRLADNLSLALGLAGGVVSGQGGANTRAVDRFFIGGADFRGFAARGIGPRDENDAGFVGAEKYFTASVELQRELGDVFGTTGRIGVFAEAGSAWSLSDNLAGAIDDSRHMRSSIGVSFEVDIGKVPVSIFVAKALDKRPGDDTQSVGISFSTQF